jgi:amino acid transporter
MTAWTKPPAEAARIADAPRGTAGLVRSLGFTTLLFYGVGDILGAGVYALAGKVAGAAGSAAWLSFLAAGAAAALTGLAYAEWTAREPRAAGAAAFAARAYRSPTAAFLVGFLVLASGLTSAATVSLAFRGYLGVFRDVPVLPAAAGLVVLMGLLAFWGMRESAAVNNVMTALEVSGLLCVILAGVTFVTFSHSTAQTLSLVPSAADLPGVLPGAVLAFYAFIGFEDMANLAEEAKDPARDIPRALLWAVGICGALYLAVILTVLSVLSPAEAAASSTPLLDVLTRAGFPVPAPVFAALALVAVLNTGLANLIMGSRLLYGMAGQGLVPRFLAAVHPKRRTPWAAVAAVAGITLTLAFTGGAALLAQTTSLLLLFVFLSLHAGLLIVRRREPAAAGLFRAPAFVPYAGIALCGLLASQAPAGAWLRAAVVVAAGLAAGAAFRPSVKSADEVLN